ncbi:PilZ domain-containing protein [Syntrophus gentianae]|uniref:PilZ domain-containing protein n=1 Tax=Syntrophus gentianae TaxID=43775 RepID=A0A1H7VRM3_9BACT|nr:PilZ domain-containing protein [Syntrophus gentianae]SEM11495.1 PilZ domain-containing protein [Syntrophus gentianae]
MGGRKFSRILFDREVLLRIGDAVLRGEIENLSLQGALLKTEHPLKLQDIVNIELRLSDEPTPLILELQGTVVRCEQEKAAIHFTRMEPDSFIHLKNIMAYNQGDEAIVRDELAKYLSGKD